MVSDALAAARARLAAGDVDGVVAACRSLIEHGQYNDAGTLLLHAGQFDLADEVHREGMARNPGDVALVIGYAWTAHGRGDYGEAQRRWADLHARFPNEPYGLTGAAVSAREAGDLASADRFVEQALERFPDADSTRIEYARLAVARGDTDSAIARWRDVRDRFPDHPVALAEGPLPQNDTQTAPNEAIARAAKVSEHSDLDDDAARYETLRRTAPDDWTGYFMGAQILAGQNLVTVAEALLEAGARRLPDNAMLAFGLARIPVSSPKMEERDPAEATRRAEGLRRRFPDFPAGWVFGAECLIGERRHEEADALSREARDRFPADLSIALLHAGIARDRKLGAIALDRYRDVLERFGAVPDALAGFASVLIAEGRTEDADRVLAEALRWTPDSRALLGEYAHAAERRADWHEAQRRWGIVTEKFPNDIEAQKRAFETRMRLAETGEQDDSDQTGIAAAGAKRDRDFVLRFESLGGSGLGCEFGLFQRAYGAEPLSLLRWTDIEPAGLIAALESRFDGVGDEDNTEIFLHETGTGPDYRSRDRRYHMLMACYVTPDQIPMDEMLTLTARRQRFLARKQVTRLTEGAKIFVYRNAKRDLTDAELHALHRAVTSYGDTTLLYVRLADKDHPHGTVIAPAPGLLVGYIQHFAVAADGRDLPSPYAYWMDVCRNAYALWPRARG